MKFCTRILTICILFAGQTAQAKVNCSAMAAFDRLNDSEVRLRQYQTPARFRRDALILEAELEFVHTINLENALGSNSLAQEIEVFATFVTHADRLRTLLWTGDPDIVRQYLNTPTVMRNNERLSFHLRMLPCEWPTTLSTPPPQTEPPKIGPSKSILIYVTTIAAMVIAAAIGGFASWIFFRNRRREMRRTQRFSTNYTTTYRDNNGTYPATLLDISGWGGKLKHIPDNPPKNGEDIEIVIVDEQMIGTIVWQNAHYSGVRFKKALSKDMVLNVLKCARAQQDDI